jgi:hypothetical protein
MVRIIRVRYWSQVTAFRSGKVIGRSTDDHGESDARRTDCRISAAPSPGIIE